MASIKLLNNLDQNILQIEIPCQFGRETGDLTFPKDDSVSTLHGEFLLSDGSVFVLDLGSTNGTYLNDQKIEANQKILIQDDDLIEFGEQTFHIGVTDEFMPENVQERYQEKKTERLRQILNASKTEKLNSIKNKIKTLENKRDQIKEQLNTINEKYKNGKKTERSLIEKKSMIDQNIQNFTHILTKKNQELDDKKRKLFTKKTNLDDQIKLLSLTPDQESDKISNLNRELEQLKLQIDAIAEEKKNFPLKLDSLKKNQIIMEKAILETSLKLRKVGEIIRQNETKYTPILEKISIQLQQLDREESKIVGESTETKTRQL